MSKTYALEGILKMRQDIEDKHLLSMTQSLEFYQKNVEMEQALEQEISRTMDLIHALSEGDLINQKAMYRYLEKLRADFDEQRRSVHMAKVVYENKKSEYVAAQRDRKVIEKHKVGYMEKMRLELGRMESIQTNELAIATFNRGRRLR